MTTTAQDNLWSTETPSRLPATWALIGVLVTVHVATGVVYAIVEDVSVVNALLFDRGMWMRMEVGGQHRIPLRTGEYWRLFTSVLLHGDALHLLINTASLYALGRLLEPVLGAARWLGWFALGGVLASFLGWQVGVIQSDGASGGAFALLAAGVWLGVVHRDQWDPADRRLMGPVLAVFLVLNFALGWVMPGIDALAHTFGLVTGLALAAVDPAKRSTTPYVVTLVVCIAACLYGWSFGLLGA
jgi:rhomboid protease GluP